MTMTTAPQPGASETGELTVAHTPDLLIARFASDQAMASWAIVGGGLRTARAVAWVQVREGDLPPGLDAAALLRDRLAAAGVPDAVGLLTTRRLDRYVDVCVRHAEIAARCIATVGTGNALRAGDPPGASRFGTINVLCHVSVALSLEARLEALALAAEARTLAVHEAAVPSVRTGRPASGTGTDCIVIAAPDRGAASPYAGKHTAIGHVIGAAVHEATQRGVACCQREWAEQRAAEVSQ
jgi:adenosylcobinamide amidohydrolase